MNIKNVGHYVALLQEAYDKPIKASLIKTHFCFTLQNLGYLDGALLEDTYGTWQFMITPKGKSTLEAILMVITGNADFWEKPTDFEIIGDIKHSDINKD